MTRRAPAWVVVAPLLGVVACANIWGFEDLTLSPPDAALQDATMPSDAPGTVSEAGGDAEVDAFAEGDVFGGDAADARVYGEGGMGDGGHPGEGGAKDAGDDAAIPYCKANCPMGCCDSTGHCVTILSPRACGTAGATCVDCTTTTGATCTAVTPACCGSTTGQCGCSLATVGCSKN